MSEHDQLIFEAWGRIGQTEDGRIARKLLIERLLQVNSGATDLGALSKDMGERSFADKLVKLLDSTFVQKLSDNDSSPRRASAVRYSPRVRAV